MSEPQKPTTRLVEGRSCEGCTMCCNLMKIDELKKPAAVWCQHCEIDEGCGIYEDRPQVCRDFYCAYRLSPDVGEEWRPSVSRMVVNYESGRNRINIAVDASRSGAWREPPYIGPIKFWAQNALLGRGHLMVWDAGESIIVLPDREVNLGRLGNRIVVVMGRTTPHGEEYDALALAPDDPRLQLYKPTV